MVDAKNWWQNQHADATTPNDGDVPVYDAAFDVWKPNALSSGALQAKKFAFAWNTPNLKAIDSGIALKTGDIIIDIGINLASAVGSSITAWTGSGGAAKAKVDTYIGTPAGTGLFFNWDANAKIGPIDLGLIGDYDGGAFVQPSDGYAGGFEYFALINNNTATSWLSQFVAYYNTIGVVGYPVYHRVGIDGNVFLCISQDGSPTGADADVTGGTAELYVFFIRPS